jgi:hypothetical protein
MLNPIVDFVADFANLFNRLSFRTLERQSSRFTPGNVRTFVPTSHRHQDLCLLRKFGRQFGGGCGSEIDPNFAHRCNDFRVDMRSWLLICAANDGCYYNEYGSEKLAACDGGDHYGNQRCRISPYGRDRTNTSIDHMSVVVSRTSSNPDRRIAWRSNCGG